MERTFRAKVEDKREFFNLKVEPPGSTVKSFGRRGRKRLQLEVEFLNERFLLVIMLCHLYDSY